MGFVLDPFDGAIAQRALLELLILSLACGPLGVWILAFRQSYAAESLAHAMLPGLVLAALAGVPLVLGALGGVLVGALLIGAAGRDERLGGDIGVAVAVTSLFGLGTILALSPAAPARLTELLFGNLLGVTSGDLAVAAGLVVVVALVLAGAHRRLTLAAFDPLAARSLGVSAARAELLVLALMAVTTVAAVQGLGNLLVVALLLAPGAAAQAVTRRLTSALALAAALSALSGALGLMLSYHLDVAAGAAVALCAVAIFALCLLAGGRRAGTGPAARSHRRLPIEAVTDR